METKSLLEICKYVSDDILDRISKDIASDPVDLFVELKLFDKAIALLDDSVKSKIRLGAIYNDMHKFELVPDVLDFETTGIDEFYRLHALAIAYHYLGKDASVLLHKCLELDVSDVIKQSALPALSTYYFKKGDFTTAVKYLQVSNDSQYPDTWYWDGIIRVGSEITIGYNGGIGDQIVSCRFYKHFADLGMLPVIHVANPYLREVFENNGMRCTDLPKGPMVNIIGNVCDIPCLLGLDKEDVWYGPYLKPSRKVIDKFRGYKGIGVQCGGDPLYQFNDTRIIDPDKLDITGYSLNIVESCDKFIDMKSYLKTIDDTMGLIYNLDCVVTSDTSVAHMAAAMRKPVFVMVPISSFYTWDCNVWYDSVHCYYQKEFGKWNYTEINNEIKKWIDAL